MWSRLALRTKLTFLVVTVIAVASWTFAKLAYSGLVDLMNKVTGLRALTVAESLAAVIDPVWFETADFRGGPDAKQDSLQNQVGKLVGFGRVYRIAIVRLQSKDMIEHAINVPADGTLDYHPPGSIENLKPWDVYREKASGYEAVELATPGAFMAGWAPITAGEKVVGIVLVAIDINETQSALNTANKVILAAMLVLILLSGLVAYKFASTFEKTAVTDGLMGIYNHKFFKQRLEQETAKSARYGQQTSLVMLDIDFFKKVNDTYGHATGDLVLKNLAKWVTETARNTDVVARYGGEEIGIILTHTGVAGAQEFAERLRLKVSQQVIKDPEEDAEFRVTISIGVAQWEKGVSFLELIKRADAALYHSKHTGRNRVTIYQEEILPAPETQQKTGS